MAIRLLIDNGVEFEDALLIAIALLVVLLLLNLLVLFRRFRHSKDVRMSPEFLHPLIAKLRQLVIKVLPQKVKTHKKILVRSIFIFISLIVSVGAGLVVFDMLQGPGIRGHYPLNDGQLVNYDEPITITFDRPVDTATFQPYIFPEIDGDWVAESVSESMPDFKRRIAFYPKESMFPGKVFIYYAEVTDSLGLQEKWEYGIDAFSVPVPDVVSSSPEDKASAVAVDQEIQFTLNNETGDFIQWDFEIEPEVSHTIYSSDTKTVNVRFEDSLSQNTEYTYRLLRTPVRYRLDTGEVIDQQETAEATTGSFKTVKEPLLESINPKGEGVYTTNDIVVVFDQQMQRESAQQAFQIQPEVEGEFSWKNYKTMVFNPSEDLKKDTKYTVTLKKGVRSSKGGFTEKKVTHSFSTIGAVTAGFSPSGTSVVIGSNISVYFNQPVDKASAESKFSINPNVTGAITWSGNTMIFNPQPNLNYQTTYTVSVAAGVKSIHGLDSRAAFSRTFTTEAQVFTLNVPVYYQSLRFSCNLVAARMALAYRGISVSTLSAHSQIAKDSTPWNPGANTWGNPHVGYVGDIYGNNEGYGVYWGPLSSWLSGYRSNAVRVGWGRTDMLRAVRDGNPVIIWAHNGYSGSGANRSWSTPSGTNIYAIQGMHSYVVVGWVGNINNPSHIILNDPNRGRWTVTTGYFDALWSYFGRASVVVY